MTIAETILNLMELAKRNNMTFKELLEWLNRTDREENILPWEE